MIDEFTIETIDAYTMLTANEETLLKLINDTPTSPSNKNKIN